MRNSWGADLDNKGEHAMDGDCIVAVVGDSVALNSWPPSCSNTVDAVSIARQQGRLITIADLARVGGECVVQKLRLNSNLRLVSGFSGFQVRARIEWYIWGSGRLGIVHKVLKTHTGGHTHCS